MNKPIASTNITEKPGGEGATPGAKPVAINIQAERVTEVFSETLVEKPGGEGATPGAKHGGSAQ